MADSIRAALERLVNAVEVYDATGMDVLGDAIAAARAALAEQQGNEAQVSLFVDSHIDPEHQGEDRQILHVFYDACMSEGGTADEIHLRGLRAVLSRWGHQPAPPADGEVAAISNAIDTMRLALKSHGAFLPSDPPQDAWKFRGVSMRLSDAICQLEKLKESINE